MFFTQAAFESPLTAGYAGPFRAACAGKNRDRALIHYCWRTDPDRLWLHHLLHHSADVAIHVDPDRHGSRSGYDLFWSRAYRRITGNSTGKTLNINDVNLSCS